MTHGGYASTIEALTQGIPMYVASTYICILHTYTINTREHLRIGWPFGADQPLNVTHMTIIDVAFELLEVRTGHGLKPLLDRKVTPSGTEEAFRHEIEGVLDMAKGLEGFMKKKNAKRVQAKIRAAWEENGTGRKDLDELMQVLLRVRET